MAPPPSPGSPRQAPGRSMRRTNHSRWARLAVLLAATVGSAFALAAPAPLQAAEVIGPRRLEYRVAWNGIPAASATVDVTTEEFAGNRGYVIEAAGQTNAFVDVFWMFRGRARTTFLASGLTPLSFVYDSIANRKRVLTWIDHDPAAGRARSVHIKKGRRHDFDLDAAQMVDPITTTFRAMASGAGPGDRLSYRVFTGKTHYRVDLRVIGEEVVAVPAGRFQALRIEPEVWKLKETTKRDKRVRSTTVWVANDPTRTPLRIRSKLLVGAVTFDLVRVELRPASRTDHAARGPAAAPIPAAGRDEPTSG